jgi:hypothetical protein
MIVSIPYLFWGRDIERKREYEYTTNNDEIKIHKKKSKSS